VQGRMHSSAPASQARQMNRVGTAASAVRRPRSVGPRAFDSAPSLLAASFFRLATPCGRVLREDCDGSGWRLGQSLRRVWARSPRDRGGPICPPLLASPARTAEGGRSHMGLAGRIGVWWAHQDLNLEPTDYESAALTVELWAREAGSSISRAGAREQRSRQGSEIPSKQIPLRLFSGP